MSRVVHLLSNPGYLAISFLLRCVTCSYSIGLLDLFVILNAQAIISCLDVFDEWGRGGAEFLKILIQLVISGNMLEVQSDNISSRWLRSA